MSLRVSTLTGDKDLFRDVSFEVKAGEVLAIIGPNGAGKTSLLKALVGDWPCVNGDVSYGDTLLAAWPLKERAKQLAILPQLSLLNFPYTVEEVVMLGRTPHATGQEYDRQQVDQWLQQLDIVHLRQQLYTQLSGGEKQRTQLARVLAQLSYPEGEAPARYLFLDEPTASLDLGHQQQLMQVIRAFADQGGSVIMVLHDISLAARYADRLLAMNLGEVVAYGAAEDVVTEGIMQQLYGVAVKVMPHPETAKPVVLGV